MCNNVKDKIFPMSENSFLVLSCLYNNDKIHGYGIKTLVKQYTDERVILSTSSIYMILERFIRTNLVTFYESKIINTDKKIVYYKITELGKQILNKEVERMEKIIKLAKK